MGNYAPVVQRLPVRLGYAKGMSSREHCLYNNYALVTQWLPARTSAVRSGGEHYMYINKISKKFAPIAQWLEHRPYIR